MKKILIKHFFTILFLLTCSLLFSETQKIRYFQVGEFYSYQVDLLNMILAKTSAEYGEAEAVPVNTKMTFDRGMLFLKKNKNVDIAFTVTDKEREKDFRAVKFPIMQGFLGYRVLMIKKDRTAEFESINILLELRKKMKAGFCSQWEDLKKLNSNKIPVDNSAAVKDDLYHKLDTGKFDYIPMELNTAWKEVELLSKKYPDFTIDEKSGFYCPYPVYYFVNKDNTPLAGRLEKGLEAAFKDGSLKELFLKHFVEEIGKAAPGTRNYFVLENPDLPDDALIPDTAWWFNNKEWYDKIWGS